MLNGNEKYHMTHIFTPLKYGSLGDGLYRSSYPTSRTLPFISTLGLKSMICLSPLDIQSDLRDFCDVSKIILVEAEVGINQEPFTCMSSLMINDVIAFLLSPENRPCLLFCTKGTHRVNCVISCIRKAQGWSMSSITQEYELFSGEEISSLDLQFVDRYVYTSMD